MSYERHRKSGMDLAVEGFCLAIAIFLAQIVITLIVAMIGSVIGTITKTAGPIVVPPTRNRNRPIIRPSQIRR